MLRSKSSRSWSLRSKGLPFSIAAEVIGSNENILVISNIEHLS